MTRGRPPLQAQKDAVPSQGSGERSGLTSPSPATLCDFTIMSPGRVAFVCVKHIRRLRCTTVELTRKFSETITALRLITDSPVISRELWIRSPRGCVAVFPD